MPSSSALPKYLAKVSDKKDEEDGGPMYISAGTGVFAFAGDVSSGRIGLFDLRSGEHMVKHELKDGDKPTCVSTAFDSGKGAFGTESGEIFVWDVSFPAVFESFKTEVRKGEASPAPDTPKDGIECMSWHPRGHVLATGSTAGTLTVWDMCLGNPAFSIPKAHGGTITDLIWTGHGKQLITVSADNELRLWNSRRSEIMGVIEGKEKPEMWHTGGITVVDALPDLSRVALTGGKDGTTFLSVLKPGEKEGMGVFSALSKHTSEITAVKMGPLECTKPMRCVSASKDGEIHMFDMERKLPMAKFNHQGDADGVVHLEFNNNGDVLFSAAGNCVKAWDSRATKDEMPEISFDTDSKVSSFAISNDGSNIMLGCEDGSMRCFDMRYPVGNPPLSPDMPNIRQLMV